MLEFEYVNRKSKVIEDIEAGDYLIKEEDDDGDYLVIKGMFADFNLLNVKKGLIVFEEDTRKYEIIEYLNKRKYRKVKVKITIYNE